MDQRTLWLIHVNWLVQITMKKGTRDIKLLNKPSFSYHHFKDQPNGCCSNHFCSVVEESYDCSVPNEDAILFPKVRNCGWISELQLENHWTCRNLIARPFCHHFLLVQINHINILWVKKIPHGKSSPSFETMRDFLIDGQTRTFLREILPIWEERVVEPTWVIGR